MLSLLVEPRSLRKWFFMWAFLGYLALCWAAYFRWEGPRLAHDSYVRFGADSPTYWQFIEAREQHAEERQTTLVSFTGNLLGPVLIGLTFRTGVGVALFDIFLFFLSVEIAASIPGFDRYRFLFLLAICAETFPAMVTLNKEIFVLLTAVLMAKYIYSAKRGRGLFYLLSAMLVSVFARWEQVAIILLFVFLHRKRSIFRRNPKLAVAAVIAVLTVMYGLIARIPHSGLAAFTQYANGANTIAKLNAIQAHFGFPLVVVPKLIMDVFGELLRPWTFVKEYYDLGTGDIHSVFIIPLFSLAFIWILWTTYRRGQLTPKNPLMLLGIVYMLVTAIAPFVQPRYNYFFYCLLALQLSKPEALHEADEDDEPELLPASV